jgi:hypothetical protein
MRIRASRIAAAALIIASTSCGDRAGQQTVDTLDERVSSEAAQPVAPRSLDEIAPGDTLGILALMRATMSDGEQLASTLERRDTTMPPDGYREARVLSLWKSGNLPVKLLATEPNEDGLMRLETVTWFVAGDIAVVQEPFAVMLFDADRLVMWTDEAMEPVDAPEMDRMSKEKSVVDSVRARLKVFGITYP